MLQNKTPLVHHIQPQEVRTQVYWRWDIFFSKKLLNLKLGGGVIFGAFTTLKNDKALIHDLGVKRNERYKFLTP